MRNTLRIACLVFFHAFLFSLATSAQTLITPAGTVQNLDARILPTGWKSEATGTSGKTLTAYYRNATGAVLNTVTINFSVDRSVSGSVHLFSSPDGKTWTPQNISSPSAELKTVTLTGLHIANNNDLYLRWVFANADLQRTGITSVTLAAVGVSASLGDNLVDANSDGKANPGETIIYRDTVKTIGASDVLAIVLSDTSAPTGTTKSSAVSTSALAIADTFAFNTTTNSGNVLINDFGLKDGARNLSVVSFGTTASNGITTPAGSAGTSNHAAAVTVNSDGSFSYTPASAFTGVDNFTYIATTSAGLPNNKAVVMITVTSDLAFTTTNVDPTCNNGTNGIITVNATGGNGSYTYSKDNGVNYQGSNVFNGLASGTYNIVVKDAGGYTKSGTATLNNPALIGVIGSNIPNQIYNTAMSPSITYSKTGGTGSPTNPWSATGLPAGITINSSTGTVSGTPTQTGTFTPTITYTDANNCTGSLTLASFKVAPQLANDSYTVVGNTQLVADGQSTPTTPYTTSTTNILANDHSDAPITTTPVTNAATTNGGKITIDANGRFTYTPKNGSITPPADTYTYTGTSNGVTATATISFSVSNMIWYVNNAYGGGGNNGSSNTPYTDVASAEIASASGDYIYVHTGSGSTPATSGNATLKQGQTLRGAGSALNVGTLSIAAGTNPTLSGTVTLANSVTVDGFDMSTGNTTAITSSGATSVNVNIGNVITSGAPSGITLTNTTGIVTIAGGSQTNSTGTAFNVSGGSANITYGGTLSQATSSQRAINIASATGGTIAFNGAISSTASSTGINLATNTGATINFTGAITLNTGASAAFTATGGGTVSATGSGSTITTTTGTALNVTSTTIGASGLTFQSISSNGGTNGIILDNTGSSSGLTVTGTIGSVTRDNSGGTIQNLTGADGATTGHGVYLNSTLNPSLNHMNIHNNQGDGIHGNSVNGFTLTYTNMTNNGTTTAQLGNFHGEGDVNFVSLFGSAAVNNNDFQLAYYNTFGVFNDVTPVSLNRIVMSNNTFGANDFTGGNAGVVFRAISGTMNITFGSSAGTANTITGAASNTFILDMHGTMSADLIMKNNAISNNHGNIVTGGGGVSLQSGGTGDQVTFTFNVDGNTFSGSHGAGFNIGTGVLHNGQNFSGTFNNNTIGIQGTANSGSTVGNDLFIQNSGSSMNINVTNNKLYQYNPNGTGAMQLQVGDDGSHIASTKFVVTGNTISNPGTNAAAQTYNGIQLNSGPTSTDASVTCLTITGNSVAGSGNASQGSADIRLRQRNNTDVYLIGWSGGTGVTDTGGVNTYVTGANTGSPSCSSIVQPSPPHGFHGGSCPF